MGLDDLDDDMIDLLRRIAGGQMAFGPDPNAHNQEAELERFQGEADDIMYTLDRLKAADIIGDYTTHEVAGKIDRVLITWGLSFEGQELARRLKEEDSQQ